jgi:alpha-1,2-mannosyltransferase
LSATVGRDPKRRRLLVAGGALVLAAIVCWSYLILPLRHLGDTGGDFRGYHQAARALLEGRSPYLDGAFSYPPLLAIVVVPLAALPLEAARLIWFAASLVALMGAFGLTYRGLGHTPLALAATATVWGLAGTVPANLVLGQVNPFLLLLLAAAGASVTQRPVAAAAAIGVATALKVWPGALLVIFVMRRQWRELAVGAATALLLFAAPAMVASAMVEGPMSVTEQSVPMGTAAPLNVSLPALALRLADPPLGGTMPAPWLEGVAPRGWEPLSRRGWLSAVVALSVLAAAALALDRARPRARSATAIELGVMTAAAILASPVSWYHYQLCQFPAMALVLERRLAAGRWRAAAFVALLSVALTRAQPWLFGRYVERWGWTAEAPVALWLTTSVGPILAAAWLILVAREAARRNAPSAAPTR